MFTPICWWNMLIIEHQCVYVTHCSGWYNSASMLWWCQAVIKYVNTSRGPSAFGRSTKLNDNAIIWSRLLLAIDTQSAEWYDNHRTPTNKTTNCGFISRRNCYHTIVHSFFSTKLRTICVSPTPWRITITINMIATLAETRMLMESLLW